jgi:hypothetical protein
MDIERLDIDEFEDVVSTVVVLKDPMTGGSTSATITLAGPEHPMRKRFTLDRARRLRAGFQKTGKIQLGDPEDDEADEVDFLVASTLGWSGLRSAGEELPFSAAAARQLYLNPKRRWLREQVKAALDEKDRFIQRSATNSSPPQSAN